MAAAEVSDVTATAGNAGLHLRVRPLRLPGTSMLPLLERPGTDILRPLLVLPCTFLLSLLLLLRLLPSLVKSPPFRYFPHDPH